MLSVQKKLFLASFLYISLSVVFAVNIPLAFASVSQIFNEEASIIKSDGGKFYWLASDGAYNQIYTYDPASGMTTHTTTAYNKGLSSVSGNKVVYKDIQYYSCGNILCSGFSIYDLATNTKIELSALDNTYSNPQIEGNKVVWMTFNTYDVYTPSVYLYDIQSNTTTRLGDSGGGTNNNPNAYFPQINQGKVIWNNNGLYLYDIAAATTTQISSSDVMKINSPRQIDNNKIVWHQKDENTNTERINMYDITTGIITQISSATSSAFPPRIDNGKVVWFSYDGNDTELFFMI